MGVFISRRIFGLCTLGPLYGGACGIESDYHHFQQLTQEPVSTAESGGSSFPGTSSSGAGPVDTSGSDTSSGGAGQTTSDSTGLVDASGEDEAGSTSTGEAPVCGNSVVEDGEECDAVDPMCHGCIRDRLIFVTSESISGSFASQGDLCNHFADIAGLLPDHQGRFEPWLSNSSSSARERLNHSGGRYVLLSGDVVAESWDDLVDGELLHAPNIDEFGELRELEVWTGTLSDGSAAPGAADCDDWALDDINVKGSWGHSGYSDDRWSYWADVEDNPTTCAAEFSLYCVETS
jgi:hypothetical protein